MIKNKPEEWESIKQILSVITADVIMRPRDFLSNNEDQEEQVDENAQTDNGQEALGNQEAENDNAFILDYVYQILAGKNGWETSAINDKIHSMLNIVNGQTKNKVLTYYVSNKFAANQFNEIIYIMAPRAVVLGEAELTLVLVPDENIKTLFKVLLNQDGEPGVGSPFTENECRTRLYDLYPINNSAPMAFIFCSLDDSEIVVDDIPSDGIPSVDRALVFPPEFYQAGVTVLSNFGNILKQKYPNINARVRIEQDGNTVRMHVALPDGEVKVVRFPIR